MAAAKSRLVFLVLGYGVVAGSLALGARTLAAAGDAQAAQTPSPTSPSATAPPVRAVMAQKQLVSATNCQSVAHATAKPDFLSTSAEYHDDVRITTGYCSATAHNQLTPGKPEILVVGADPKAAGDVKIFFRTIAKNDAQKLRDTCALAAKATFAYLQTSATTQTDAAIAGADILTSSGQTDCIDFLRATAADNPLVVLAPSVISGSTISVHILNMIGLKKPAAEVQAAVDSLGNHVAGSAALSTDEIRTHPQIVLQPSGPNPP
jgi:hypothetical protein